MSLLEILYELELALSLARYAVDGAPRRDEQEAIDLCALMAATDFMLRRYREHIAHPKEPAAS